MNKMKEATYQALRDQVGTIDVIRAADGWECRSCGALIQGNWPHEPVEPRHKKVVVLDGHRRVIVCCPQG